MMHARRASSTTHAFCVGAAFVARHAPIPFELPPPPPQLPIPAQHPYRAPAPDNIGRWEIQREPAHPTRPSHFETEIMKMHGEHN